MDAPPLEIKDSSCISKQAEMHIIEELHNDLIQEMSPLDISYSMVTERLLHLEQFKTFMEMKDDPQANQNAFLLTCLVEGPQGFLCKFEKLLRNTAAKNVAKHMRTRMAAAASSISVGEPEAKWREEKKKMKDDMKKLKKNNTLLKRENEHLKICITKFQSDVKSSFQTHRFYINQVHPISQPSSDTDPLTSDNDLNYTSSPESCSSSEAAVEETGSATLIPYTYNVKDSSTQSISTDLHPWNPVTSAPNSSQSSAATVKALALKPNYKPFCGLVSQPNSHQGSLLSLASGSSDRNTTEALSNIGSMMLLSGSSEQSIDEAENIKPASAQNGLSSSKSACPTMPLSNSSGKSNPNGVSTKCVSTQTSSSSINTAKSNTPAVQKFSDVMKKRRVLIDSGKVTGAINDLL